MERGVSFESQAGLHGNGPVCQAEDPESGTREPGQGCQQESASLRFAFYRDSPSCSWGLYCSCPYFYVCLGHPPGTLRGEAHVARCLNVSGQL